jgi:hypothetical protein
MCAESSCTSVGAAQHRYSAPGGSPLARDNGYVPALLRFLVLAALLVTTVVSGGVSPRQFPPPDLSGGPWPTVYKIGNGPSRLVGWA